MILRLACGFVVILAAAGCGGGNMPDSPAPGPGGETITGSERLGWDQRGADATEVGTLRFAIYVDGARSVMSDTSCAATAGTAGFPCSGRLPPLTPGVHTLELAAFVQTDTLLESPRSSPFRVTVVASMPQRGASATWTSGAAGVTGDGVHLEVERLVDGLQRPADAAFLPDGRLLVAERAGRIRIVRDGVLQPAPALELSDIAPGGGLLAIALAPDFLESRHVFTLSTAGSARGPVFRLARYRELGGTLAQRAVLLEAPAAVPAAAMRFGPDGMLYLALGGHPASPSSAYGGKILRLQPDGRAPRDRRAGLPVVSSGHVAPRAIAWRPGAPATWLPPSGEHEPLLWIADGTPDGVEWISGMYLAEPPAALWGLPPSETTSAMAFYDSNRIPEFRGDLLIASAGAQRLLRIKFGADPLRAEYSEPLLEHRVGPLHVVLTGPDGAIYFCTDTELGRLRIASP